MKFEDWINLIQLILALAFILAIAVLIVIMLNASARCIEHGYPGYKVIWNLEQYCIKRVNQTDVVTPLDALGKEK